jgi:GH18 family chitinase
VHFEFLGRKWLKSADHERELTAIYGDWRTPDQNWDYLYDDLSIRSVTTWAHPLSSVNGPG